MEPEDYHVVRMCAADLDMEQAWVDWIRNEEPLMRDFAARIMHLELSWEPSKKSPCVVIKQSGGFFTTAIDRVNASHAAFSAGWHAHR